MSQRSALNDVRVLELGQLIAGPFCGQLLADLGAEVIKLERPGTGDPMRQWGVTKEGRSLWWTVIARNKKSVTCDLSTVEGQQVFKRLVALSDIVIENFRPGTLERWGLDYETLRSINRGLILVRISGYGQSGPKARQAGFGAQAEAMGGLRYLTGDPDRPPSRVGISIGDSLAGMVGALGALAALHARIGTGTGQIVDVALYEAVLAVMESLLTDWSVAGVQRERSGPILPKVAPSNVYRSADGEDILISANLDGLFRRVAEVIGRSEIADDPSYSSHAARGEHQQQLDDMISAWARTRTAQDIIAKLEAAEVPVGKIYRAADILSDSQVKARGSVVTLTDPAIGEIRMQNVAPVLSDTPGVIRWAGPGLGEHNKEVLHGLLGLSDSDGEGSADDGCPPSAMLSGRPG